MNDVERLEEGELVTGTVEEPNDGNAMVIGVGAHALQQNGIARRPWFAGVVLWATTRLGWDAAAQPLSTSGKAENRRATSIGPSGLV